MAELTQKTELVARFANGYTGWCKIALEKATSGLYGGDYLRAHCGLWVQTPGGSRAAPNAVGWSGYVSVDGWLGLPFNKWEVCKYVSLSYTDTTPPTTANYYTPWACVRGSSNIHQWRAVARDFRLKSGAEYSGWKTRITGTVSKSDVC